MKIAEMNDVMSQLASYSCRSRDGQDHASFRSEHEQPMLKESDDCGKRAYSILEYYQL
jgi:hypothetical protein